MLNIGNVYQYLHKYFQFLGHYFLRKQLDTGEMVWFSYCSIFLINQKLAIIQVFKNGKAVKQHCYSISMHKTSLKWVLKYVNSSPKVRIWYTQSKLYVYSYLYMCLVVCLKKRARKKHIKCVHPLLYSNTLPPLRVPHPWQWPLFWFPIFSNCSKLNIQI